MDKSAHKIAKLLGYTRRTIQSWIYAYNRQDLDCIREDAGRGSKSKLNSDHIQWLRQSIEQGPAKQDGVCVFHAADIQKIVQNQFCVA
jgi:transposase